MSETLKFYPPKVEQVPEREITMEKEPRLHSKVVLNFFRHAEKDGDKLTQAGRIDAAKGQGGNIRHELLSGVKNKPSVAIGGPFKRSREVALLVMEGGDMADDDITGYETVEELEAKINEKAGVKYGSKLMVDKRLNFQMTGDAFEEIKKAVGDGRLLEWVVNDSDREVAGKDPEIDWGFSRMAANFADLIKKYIKVSNNFDRIVDRKEKAGEEAVPYLERMIGSHSPSVDSFLVKIIEKVKGQEEASRFVELNKNGIGALDGFRVEIDQLVGSQEPSVRIIYSPSVKTGQEFKFNEEVGMNVLEEILKEGGGHMDSRGKLGKMKNDK